MGRFVVTVLLLAGVAFWLTLPKTDRADVVAGLSPNLENGARVFHAGGCASCHADKDSDAAAPVLAGGHRLDSPFGTFIAPNISTDATHGIGDWDALTLWNALHHGTSPANRHYYPAFPYSSYIKMTPQDVVDLHGFLQTLPASDRANTPHELTFPFNIRLGLGFWKLLALSPDWQVESDDPQIQRGRYLVEALGHCGECHTPRNQLGILQRDAWLQGAANPSGEGEIPAIHPNMLGWASEDVAYYLESGFTPDFDSVGGSMASVVANFSQLPAEDREAVAAYLTALP